MYVGLPSAIIANELRPQQRGIICHVCVERTAHTHVICGQKMNAIGSGAYVEAFSVAFCIVDDYRR